VNPTAEQAERSGKSKAVQSQNGREADFRCSGKERQQCGRKRSFTAGARIRIRTLELVLVRREIRRHVRSDAAAKERDCYKMKRPPTKHEIESTFNFVLDELLRYLELSQDAESLMQAIQDDGWPYELPFPGGHRRMIGKEAHKRLAQLARDIVATDERLIGRIRLNPHSPSSSLISLS